MMSQKQVGRLEVSRGQCQNRAVETTVVDLGGGFFTVVVGVLA